MAAPRSMPASSFSLIWAINTTELRMILPTSANTPSMATNPNGRLLMSSAIATPMMASGAVSITSNSFCVL